MLHTHAQTHEKNFDRQRRQAKIVTNTSIGCDTGLNCSFIYSVLNEGSPSVTPLIGTICFAVFWFVLISWWTGFGVDMLTDKTTNNQRKVMPLWIAGMLFLIMISLYMSAFFLSGKIAQDEYLQTQIQAAFEVENKVSTAQVNAYQLKNIFDVAAKNAGLMHSAEVSGGGMSGKSGNGPVSTTLYTLHEESKQAIKQLNAANAKAKSIQREINELKDDIRHTSKREDIDYKAKLSLLKGQFYALNLALNSLQRNLPITTITGAIDGYGRDFSNLMEPAASDRISATFSPFSVRLSKKLSGLKEAKALTIPQIQDQISNYELLVRSKRSTPLIAIAFVLSVMPLAVIACLLLISQGTQPTNEPTIKRFNKSEEKAA